MEVLITGGSGFIGSRLLDELLLAGRGTRVLDKVPCRHHPEATMVGDIRHIDVVNAACEGVATIYHLAAEHKDDVSPKSLYRDVNVGGAANLVIAAKRSGVRRIVFTSTVAVYGLHNPTAREDAEPSPFNEYGRSKLEAEHVLLDWAREDPDRSLSIVRLCVVFGEGNRGNVHNLLTQIHSGRFLMIGTGENRKSMAYVGNVARFLAGLADSAPGIRILNYADKPDLTMRELADFARKQFGRASSTLVPLPVWAGLLAGYAFDALSIITGKSLPISSVRIRKFCAETTVSTEHLDQLGFERPFSLRDGLERTIRADFST
jgi:nucleoside-diphosphate-sugar epimerase